MTSLPTLATVTIVLIILSNPAFAAQTHVTKSADRWLLNGQPAHPGSPAEGLLMNVRMVNTVFEDVGPQAVNLPVGYDPSANTAAFIARIPEYRAHGVRMFTISLQGGMPGYEGAINSGILPNGSLKSSYMARMAQVIEACDRNGMVVILSCFYQRQKSLNGAAAIRAGVENVARWIRDRGYTNVLLEVANEYKHSGFKTWVDGAWLITDAAQVELMNRARAVHPQLLVSTSGMGGGSVTPAIANGSDFILIHFNNTSLSSYQTLITTARSYGKPVVCNEDNKLGSSGAAAAAAAVQHGASWGFMHIAKNQNVPFEYTGAADDSVVYGRIRSLTDPVGAFNVAITAPVGGSSHPTPGNITITTATTGSPGTIIRMEFFANGTKIGERSASPWSLVWNHSVAGSYSLQVRATDATGAIGTSESVLITIGTANQPPHIILTTPNDGAQFPAGANITIVADAADMDGTVSQVEFFANGTKIGERHAAPWTMTWTGVAAGAYDLHARATDNTGASTVSPFVDIVVVGNNGMISGLATKFQVATFAVGSAVYTDRTFTVQSVLGYSGAQHIRTPNNDKNNTAASGYLAFTLTAAADVLVAYDSRATSLPSWLSGFTATGETVTTTDVPFRLYHQAFAAGSAVNLGGNQAAGAAGANSNYWLIVRATGTGDGGGGEPLPDPIAINFQPASAPKVAGYLVDSGLAFASRNGQQYGWNQANNTTRDRNATSDQRMDTLIHLQKSTGLVWELSVPNGTYEVHLACGDPAYTDQVNTLSIEGVIATDPDGQDLTDSYTVEVTVSDGRLTITPAAGAVNAKLMYLEVIPVVGGNG